MKVVVQRVLEASCTVNNQITGKIEEGFMLLVGFNTNDNEQNVYEMVQKVLHLRIMDDENGIMNKSILDTKGSILSISQFTLYADTKKGNRPSYLNAMNGNDAIKLYQLFNEELRKSVIVEEGIFGENMQISLINNGPVTIILERQK